MELIREDSITDEILMDCAIYNDKGKIVGVHHYNVKNYICGMLPMFNLKGTMYLYNDGVFVPDLNGTELRSVITMFIPETRLIKSSTIRQIHELFFMDSSLTATPEELNNYPKHWIAFEDCLYDCLSNKTYEYNPAYKCVNRVPWRYWKVCAAATGDKIEKFLNESLEPDDKESILEYIGYSMSVNSGFQKMVLLKGSGGTGKSTLLSLIEKIVGFENISSVPLQKIEEKFYAIMLLNKLVNICSDLSAAPMKNTNTVKMIVGEDPITDSYKGRDQVTFHTYCKMIFSANALPLILDADTTNAFFRRVIIIEMNNQPKKPNAHLREELEEDIPHLINISLKAYKRALERQYIFESERCKNLLLELQKDSDSLSAFLMDACEVEPSKKIKCKDFYNAYIEYCKNEDRTPVTKHNCHRQMASKGYQQYKSHGYDCWRGVDLSADWETAKSEEVPFRVLDKNGTE